MFTDILQSQLTDIFRAGLIIALIYTMTRTREVTGTVLPLVAGIVFVAFVVPLTSAGSSPAPLWMQIGAGLVSNAILLAAGLAIWRMVEKLRR